MKCFISLTLCFFSVFITLPTWAATDGGVPLRQLRVDPSDLPSLQRGAKTYMKYCLGCHSLHYLRYNTLAEHLGLAKGNRVTKRQLQAEWGVTPKEATAAIISGLTPEAAKQAYGVVPPDLTLVTKRKSIDWVYTYLNSFYRDKSRPLGTNNVLVPNVAMTNILAPLQGIQAPVYHRETVTVAGKPKEVLSIAYLHVVEPGKESPREFARTTGDLVNFLAYVSEPLQRVRYGIGWWVLGFLVLFAWVTYLLKRAFWRDIKK